MEKIYIVFYVLSGISFVFTVYFFYLTKVKKLVIKKNEEKEGSEKATGIMFGSDGIMKIEGSDTIISGYKVSDIINIINSFTSSFNKINKKVNIASGVVSAVAGIGFFISAVILR